MTDQQDTVDDLITDIARRMTDADPRADFSERVLTRLHARRAPSRLWWSATAGVAAVAIAFVIVRDTRSPGATAPSPMRAASAAASTLESRPATATASVLPRVQIGAAAGAESRRPRVSFVSDEARAWQERAIPALPRSEPISLEPIQPAALAIPLLEVAPIAVEPMRGAAGTVNRER